MAASSVIAQHAEWLSLLEVSGPFLSFEVLKKVFPQGLPKADDLSSKRERISSAYEEWIHNQAGLQPDPAIHRAWLDFVLRELLEWDAEVIREGQSLPVSLRATVGEHATTLTPTLAAVNPRGTEGENTPRVLIKLERPGQGLEKVLEGERWKASPATRMMTLLHATEVRLGLVTNGEHWMLVHAVPGEATTYVSFYANLFAGEEPLTLRALASLLDADALWGRSAEDTTESLFSRSRDDQFEVTDQLGSQVRRAVETLIQTIDRIDRDRGRLLLENLPEQQLYDAAVTVMMRLVFLLCAEERGLLMLGDPLYDQYYALSTLRDQLQEQADRHGKDVLARRHDAFSRLLATFRAVHGGVRHDHFHLPAYGGSLFDPDRYPFLEGREGGTSYRDTSAQPLPIDNLTVLDLLNALTLLEVRLKGTKQAEARRLSFRELDVEQIGHVYEGLLDHTAKRAKGPVVSLQGKHEPEIQIDELSSRLEKDGEDAFVRWLTERTGRTANAVSRDLRYKIPSEDRTRWLMVCDNKPKLLDKLSRWAGLVRQDAHQRPVVYDEGAVYVAEGTDRRSTGTHYTPRSLTEPIVRHALESLVYEGPAEGKSNEEWRLKSAAELLKLKVCDMAMGSGAFLVEVIRYLSARLVEAWEEAEQAAGGELLLTPKGELTKGDPRERAIPSNSEERLAIARRVVADRCVYGVDKNPMAVEMAKLSLWLVTLQKNKPFTFLDHALRCGDSLLGLTNEEQVRHFHIDPSRVPNADGPLFRWGARLGPALANAKRIRNAIESFSVDTLGHAQEKERLLREADAPLSDLKLVADLVIGAVLATAGRGDVVLDEKLADLLPAATRVLGLVENDPDRAKGRIALREVVHDLLSTVLPTGRTEVRPFHWILEFPEVMQQGGFHALIGNPPFLGGTKLESNLGAAVRASLVSHVAGGRVGERGAVDLCVYFLLRGVILLRATGAMGLVLSNSVAQGDSREVGLDFLLARGKSIHRAVSSAVWPGQATVYYSLVWLCSGIWGGAVFLDGKRVGGIGAALSSAVGKAPYKLKSNKGLAFEGVKLAGKGFVLSSEEASSLPERAIAAGVVAPYLTGNAINTDPLQRPTEWVINFLDWPLERSAGMDGTRLVAGDFAECLEIVRQRVKPQRDALPPTTPWNRKLRQFWWHLGQWRWALYEAISGLDRVLVLSRVSPYLAWSTVDTGVVFSDRLTVLACANPAVFALLQSSFHYEWVLERGTTNLSNLSYSPASCLLTFPAPSSGALCECTSHGLTEAGDSYQRVRAAVMKRNEVGLTEVYGRFHDPSEQGSAVAQLREEAIRLDYVVRNAYRWGDIDLNHGFRETKQGVRFTVGESARLAIIDRLVALNHERHAEEVREVVHDKTSLENSSSVARRKSARKKKTARPQAEREAPRQSGFGFTEEE